MQSIEAKHKTSHVEKLLQNAPSHNMSDEVLHVTVGTALTMRASAKCENNVQLDVVSAAHKRTDHDVKVDADKMRQQTVGSLMLLIW